MRICLHTVREVSPDFIGGTERFLIELAKELETLGHHVSIVCSGLRRTFDIDGVRIIQQMPAAFVEGYRRHGMANSNFIRSEIMKGEISLSAFSALGAFVDEQLRAHQADVFHLNSFSASLFAAASRNAIITNHENELEFDRAWGAGATETVIELSKRTDAQLRNASALTTPSSHYADEFSKKLDLAVRPVRLGIRLESFPFTRRRSEQCEKVRILLPSRFDPIQKGHDVAIRAAAILRSRNFPFHMTFSGIRTDYQKRVEGVRSVARELGVLENITFARFADMQRAYDAADVGISPEQYCSYGLAISETLAKGLPTVLSDIPTYREIANDYGHAIFCSADSAEDFAEGILKASLLDRNLISNEAIRFRRKNDLRKSAERYCDLYQSVSRNRSGV